MTVYTQFLREVAGLEDATVVDAAVDRLIAHLKQTGQKHVLPKLLPALRRLAAERANLEPQVEVARQSDAAAALSVAAKEGISATKASVNPELVAGWRARGGGKLIDRSAKHALMQIYQNVTA